MSEETKISQGEREWIVPIIEALKDLGGSAKVKDVYEKIKSNLNLSEEVLSELTPKVQGNKFKSQIRWARAFLVRDGYIDGSNRGIWTLTPLGKTTVFTDELIAKMMSDHVTGYSGKNSVSNDEDSNNKDSKGENNKEEQQLEFEDVIENRKADDDLAEQIKEDKFTGFTTKQEYLRKPVAKVEAVQHGSRKVYPRSIVNARKAQNIAGYKCEFDGRHETFINKVSGLPYLENHHLIPLAYYGKFSNSLDIPENIITLCSNCHNRIHYGKDADVLIRKFYEERKVLLKDAGIEITLEELLEMY